MAKKKPKKDNAGRYASPKSQEENKEKGWRYVFVWVVPVAIGFLLAAISIIWASHKWLAIVAAIGAVISFLGYFLFLAEWYVWQGRTQRKRARWLFGVLGLAVSIAGAFWVHRIWTQSPPAFLATVASELGSYKSERGGVFWAIYHTGNGDTVTPAQLGLYIEIINRQSVPTVIDAYSVEAQNRASEWFSLVRVQGISGEVFFCIDDPHKARPVDLENGLDRQIEEKAIAPQATLKGWAFFELPQDIRERSPFRITVEDNTGRAATQITEGADNLKAAKDYVQTAPLHLAAGLKDLTGYRFQMYSELFK